MAEDRRSDPVHVALPSSPSSNNDSKASSVTSNPISAGFCHHPLLPIMYPQFPANFPVQDQRGNVRGSGVYMVSPLPSSSPVLGIPPSLTLIPLTYSIPPRTNPAATGNSDGGRQEVPQPAPQPQIIIRRFQIGVQLDLLLIMKLAAMVFVFSQDGSKAKLFFAALFASIIYLYQTGAFTPLARRLSEWVHRAIAPPQHPPVREREEQDRAPGENADGQNENHVNIDEAAGPNRWGIIKEIQMFIVGFITSLLPGFHNVD